MTSEVVQKSTSVTAGFGRHGSEWVKYFPSRGRFLGNSEGTTVPLWNLVKPFYVRNTTYLREDLLGPLTSFLVSHVVVTLERFHMDK